MEVTHINHLDTHAIIGGGNVQAFSTKQDAEFFEILSSTLYSNKKLAVVREVLCNSWDANIESGKENKPVIVEITDSKMTFQDVGPGIPANMMGEIYCTYGGSTKRHDGKKTGGFGLGSKAPFAYAKNFTVTTINGGMKSVFNISRGTSATNGVPDLRCMVSVPSKDPSGVIVSIPIQREDREEFEKLVEDLAYMGGMLVKLNERTLRRVNYNTELPFILVPTNSLPSHLNAKVDRHGRRIQQESDIRYFVKYGAVVYPIPQEFVANRAITVEAGAQLIRSRNLSVIFMAPPDSIGITPSRETLSMTDKTVATLKDLFTASSAVVKKVLPSVIEAPVPAYQKKITQGITLGDSGMTTLLGMVKNPLEGYIQWCSNVKGRVDHVISESVVNSEASLINHLIYEYDSNGWGHKKIAQLLFEADKDGKKILSVIRKTVKIRNPLYGERLYFDSLRGENLGKREMHYKIHYLKKLARLCKYIERDGVNVTLEVRGWDNDSFTADRIFKESSEEALRGYHGSRLTSLFERILLDGKISHVGQVPIIVAQSVASIDRVSRLHKDVELRGKGAVIVVARKKKDFEQVKTLLIDKMKLTGVISIPEMDLIARPVAAMKQEYILSYGGQGNKQPVSHLRTNEDCKYYIFTPGHYLIPGVEGTKLNKRKLDIDHETGRMLCYLYPNLILVPGLADANELESKGIRNVFEVLAEEVEEYFADPNNHEILLDNLSGVRGYFRSYNLSAVLRFIHPSGLMEILGKKPTYRLEDRNIPTLIHVFLHILGKNLAPKYGIQHVQRAADRTQNIFNSFFGDEVQRIVDDPMMSVLLNHLPSAHEKLEPEVVPILAAAIAAGMQTTMLHQHLSKRSPR